jgi:phosphoribosylaminoimidazolecarboxamide formyltransferase/IMP cyclohydrolase
VAQYSRFIMGQALKEEEGLRRRIALEAFDEVTKLDQAILSKFHQRVANAGEERALRYGENPHQKAHLSGDLSIYFQKLSGKDLSYNNLLDINAALKLLHDFNIVLC